MDEMVERVALPKDHHELVCSFLLVFSRFEAALKRCGYVRQDGQRLIVEWRRFVQETGAQAESLNFLQALRPLQQRPPERQQIANGAIQFVADAVPDPVSLEWILEMVYRVRNNLFHGGKWPAEPARDGELLRSCLCALSYFVDLKPEVAKAYFEE